MLKDITLGQYYPADSVIHRLDPRVKLFSTILYIVALFLVNNIWGWIFQKNSIIIYVKQRCNIENIVPYFLLQTNQLYEKRSFL